MNEGSEHQRIDMSEYYGQTTVHPIGLTLLLTMMLAMLVLPRKYAVWPAIFIGCFISPAQRLILFGSNFPFLRILLIFAVIRILLRQELRGLKFGTFDLVIIVYSILYLTTHTLQQQTTKAFMFQIGLNIDLLSTYLMARSLVRTFDDLSNVTLGFIVASIPVAIAFMAEYTTHKNVFAFLGGVAFISEMREGKLRCQGAFAHAILGGCYWALVLPLVAARWFDPRQSKFLTLIGMGCCVTCVVLSASSTPLMGAVNVFVGACFYPLRRQMKAVRSALLATILLLHFVILKGSIWSLFAKMNLFGGSSGWHRTHLIEKSIDYFFEWWLTGTRDTEHWGWGLHDVTNHFLYDGVRGGFFVMLLLITMIVLTFRNVGRIMRTRVVARDRTKTILAWSLGVMLFVHIMNFMAVSYFGQITMLIWLTFGVTVSICDTVMDLDRRDRSARVSCIA